MNGWALLDNRAGNKSQILGLAEALGYPFEIKEISYTKQVYLPNIIRGKTFVGIDEKSVQKLKEPFPDFVISAGRRLFPVARSIRKMSHGKTKIIHMMNPGKAGFNEAFCMLLPEHDLYHGKTDNVIFTVGAPHRVNDKKLSEAKAEFQKELGELPSPRLALIVGGTTKTSDFTRESALALADKIKKMTFKSLMISTSRRTPKETEDILKKAFPYAYFYTPQDTGKNPYFGFLAYADKIVVTGDSISMCTEAAATGKPLYIFTEGMKLPKKHCRFHQSLYQKLAALPLMEEKEYSFTALKETERAAEEIRRRLESES